MYDSKDVYETEDLAEAEQDFEEDNKDCVEKLNITANTAFNRFKGKEILPTGNENKFSRLKYDNPFERAKRIISELTSLSKEIETNYDSNNNKIEPVTKEQLLMLIEGLTVQVKELDLNKHFGSESHFEIHDPKKILFKKLIRQFEELKFSIPEKSVDTTNHSYLLTTNNDINEHINQIKISNLLKRLDVVEKVLGDDNVKLSNIVSECPNKGIMEAVERLTAKTSLLNNQQLNAIESRLASVVNKLQNLTTVASNPTNLDQESQIKIAELYELVKKWDHVMDSVPNVIDQCVAMQEYHIKCAKLGQCITFMDVQHQQMEFKQHTSQMVVNNINDLMVANFNTMEKNFQIVEDKLKILD